jgi:hypothetical protein
MIYEVQSKAIGTPEAFDVSSKSFIFSKMLVSDTVGRKRLASLIPWSYL